MSANTPWLSVAVNGSGSFAFNVPYRITAAAANGMATGDYNGTVTVNGSSLASDNKQVGVKLHVTDQPILHVSPSPFQIRIAQGAVKQSSTTGAVPYIATSNSGQGTLTISKISAAAAADGTWLSAGTVDGFPSLVNVAADPAGLSPGTYQGTVSIESNAANGKVDIPVQLTIVAATPPVAFDSRHAAVVNNGTFADGSIARGDVVAVFGDQFTSEDPKQSTVPLVTTLAGTQVLLNGKAVPLYYVFPFQLAFEVPLDAQLGDGTLQVVRGDQKGNLVFVNIAERAPHFLLLSGGPYVIMTTPQGALTGIPSHPAAANDVAVIYVIGLGPTSPLVPEGTASPSAPPANAPDTKVCFGQQSPFSQPVCVTPDFSGLTPSVGRPVSNQREDSGRPSVRRHADLLHCGRRFQRHRANRDSMTERLYYDDSYLIEFQARVVEADAERRRVYLDRTAFYPTSGGQPFDMGKLGGVDVIEVIDEEQRIVHVLDAPLAETDVSGSVHWTRRFDHMQQHTGQHLLSAVLLDLFDAATVGFHLGAESSTIDVARAIEPAEIRDAERRANQIVFENRPVAVSYQHSSEDLGLRKPTEREGSDPHHLDPGPGPQRLRRHARSRDRRDRADPDSQARAHPREHPDRISVRPCARWSAHAPISKRSRRSHDRFQRRWMRRPRWWTRCARSCRFRPRAPQG